LKLSVFWKIWRKIPRTLFLGGRGSNGLEPALIQTYEMFYALVEVSNFFRKYLIHQTVNR